MRAMSRGITQLGSRITGIPQTVWLLGLGVVLLIRFPLKFLLEPPYLMDFEFFSTIASRILTGDAAQLYEATRSAQAVFKYAPFWALLIAPLGSVTDQTGVLVWSMLTIMWLLATCWLSQRLCALLGLRPSGVFAIIAVLLLVRPITSEFLQGQTNLLWGLLVAGFLYCEVTRRPWWAAGSLALAISLKLPALIVVPYLMLRGHWRTVGRTVLCTAALNLIGAVLLVPAHPLRLFNAWVKVLLVSAPDRAFEIGSQSVLALMGRLLRADGYGLNVLALSDGVVGWVTAILAAALFGALFVQPRRLAEPARTVVDGALLVIFMVVFSPTAWVATYSTLLFPATVAVTCAVNASHTTWRHPSLAIGVLASLLLSGLTHHRLWHLLGIHSFKGESYVYLVLMILPLLGVALAWSLWHQQRLLAPHPSSALRA
jgi:hypothetical protein